MLKPMVEVQNQGGILFAEFWDCLRLDPSPVRDLREHFESHIRAGGKPDIVIDLNGVSYAGSASLGGFIVLHRMSSQNGGRVVFCNVDDNVLEVFRVSKLISLFAFVKDRAEATRLLAEVPLRSPSPTTPSSAPRADGPLRRSRLRGTDQ